MLSRNLFRRHHQLSSLFRSFSTRAHDDSRIIVQKYGGTSVGGVDKLRKVRNIVQKFTSSNKNEQNRVVAVVSAMSGTVKSEGTTSLLLSAADHAISQESFDHDLNKIEDLHMAIVYGTFDWDRLEDVYI